MNRSRSIVLAAVFAALISVTAASAQNISVISGNGQVLSISNLLVEPLVVKVTDASGNPLAGATINWYAAGSNGIFLSTGTNQATSITDQNGQSSIYYSLPGSTFPSSNFLTAVAQTTITASVSSGSTVNFTLSQLLSSPSGQITPAVQANFINTLPDTFTGAVGTSGTQSIQIHVSGTNGQASQSIPFAAVQLLNYQNPASGPSVACLSTDPSAGFDTVLTDVNGNATCSLVFGGQPGNGHFVVAVGTVNSATITAAGYWQYSPTDDNNPTPVQSSWVSNTLFETVTPGAASSVKKIQGDNQNVAPGQTTLPLQIEIDDINGKPLSGVAVIWTVSPATAGVLNFTTGTTDLSGRSSNTLTASGNTSGPVQVKVSLVADSSKSATFTVNVIPPVVISSFTAVSGNGQSAGVNTAFAQPLVVQLAVSAGSPAGVPVQFTANGPISLSTTSATTDASGRASVSVTAGGTVGSASVTASIVGAAPVTFSLTITPPPPTITAGNFVNGADLQANSLSPCGLGAIVAPAGALAATGVAAPFPGLPMASTNVQLTFSNISAPIVSIGINAAGQEQINFQVPCQVTPASSVPVTLTVGSGSTNVNLPVGAASPGIFSTVGSDGVNRAVVVRPDGSYVSVTNPARQGETDIVVVTGLGATSQSIATGALPQPGTTATVNGTVVPGMAGQAIPLVSAQLSADLPGIYLVAFQVPTGIQTGNSVNFSIGIQVNGSTVYSGLSHLPVQ